MPETSVVCGAYLFCQDKVLLVRHRRLKAWLPPGGHKKRGESIPRALRRELHEELGLTNITFLTPLRKAAQNRTRSPLPFAVWTAAHQAGPETIHEFVGTITRQELKSIKVQKSELEGYCLMSMSELRKSRAVLQVIKKKCFLADKIRRELLTKDHLPRKPGA